MSVKGYVFTNIFNKYSLLMHCQIIVLERLRIMSGSAFNLEAYPVFLSTQLSMFD